MLNLQKRLMEEKKVAESTAISYINMLRKLNADVPFNNLSFLKSKELLEQRINEYSESTQKTYYSTIVSILSFYKDKTSYKSTYNYYFEKMMEKSKESREKDTSEKSETQKKNWLSWNEVSSKLDSLNKQIEEFSNSKHMSNSNYDTLLSAMVLSMYVLIPPRRNQDYQDLYIVKKYDSKKNDDSKNYYDLSTNKFIFNKYKTSKSYGKQELDVSENTAFLNILKMYLKHHPAKKGLEYRFLVFNDGSPLKAVNSVTRLLNKVFGKNIGSSMLRHIYLSEKYNIDEMKKDAEAMGHSVALQKEYMKSDEVKSDEKDSKQ